eukprot:10447998-Alexandrium_andersonii.AAC.1
MSASLVGSEMCIRDSCSPGGLPPPQEPPPTGASRARRRRQSRGPVGGAVSYTHLTLPTICSV